MKRVVVLALLLVGLSHRVAMAYAAVVVILLAGLAAWSASRAPANSA